MEIQDNVSKANEIARDMLPYNNAEYHACYNSAIKAMQWKDEQFVEQKQQWIEKAAVYISTHTLTTMSMVDIHNMIINFKQAMKGE